LGFARKRHQPPRNRNRTREVVVVVDRWRCHTENITTFRVQYLWSSGPPVLYMDDSLRQVVQSAQVLILTRAALCPALPLPSTDVQAKVRVRYRYHRMSGKVRSDYIWPRRPSRLFLAAPTYFGMYMASWQHPFVLSRRAATVSMPYFICHRESITMF
jgi:hypothetical protein